MSKPIIWLDSNHLSNIFGQSGNTDINRGLDVLDALYRKYDVRITNVVYDETVINDPNIARKNAIADWLSKKGIQQTSTTIPLGTPDGGEKSILEAFERTRSEGVPQWIASDDGYFDATRVGKGEAYAPNTLRTQGVANDLLASGDLNLTRYNDLRNSQSSSTTHPTQRWLPDHEAFNETPFAKQSGYKAAPDGTVTSPEGIKVPLADVAPPMGNSGTAAEAVRAPASERFSVNKAFNDIITRAGGPSKVTIGALERIGAAAVAYDVFFSLRTAQLQLNTGDRNGALQTVAALTGRLGVGTAAALAAGALGVAVGTAIFGTAAAVAITVTGIIAGIIGGTIGAFAGDGFGPGIAKAFEAIAEKLLDLFGMNSPEGLPTWLQKALGVFDNAITLPVSPLVMDLDGDGIELTSANGTGAAPVYFDMDNDGFAEASAWVKSDDGLLALDRNGNGRIDNQSELFGNSATAADGFASLRTLDSNGDGKITSADTQFNNLRVWRDLDQDGKTDTGELFTLTQLGINSINLNASTVDQTIAGNKITAESTYTKTDGTTRKIVDAWFNFDNVNTAYVGEYTLNPEALLLPQLRGYGTLPDLTIAMSKKPALLQKVKEFAAINVETYDPAAALNLVQEILYLWADVENIDPNTRGAINGRSVAFVEKLFDKLATSTPDGYIGSGPRGREIEALFYQIQSRFAAQLFLQAGGQKFFVNAPIYNSATDSFSGDYQLDFTFIDNLMTGKDLDYTVNQWGNIFTLLNGTIGLENIDANTKAQLETSIKAHDSYNILSFDLLSQIHEMHYQYSTYGTPNNDILIGTADNNNMYGNEGTDILLGLGGDDTLSGGAGADRMYGGAGNDTFITSGDIGEGLTGAIIDGGAGIDTIHSLQSNLTSIEIKGIERLEIPSMVWVNEDQLAGINELISPYTSAMLLAGSAGNYDISRKLVTGIINIYGSTGNDILTGNAESQTLYGDNGDDILNGLGGDDNLDGRTGNDILNGGDGNDTLLDYDGVDQLYGGAGDDLLFTYGIAPTGVYDGGTGTDTLRALQNDLTNVTIKDVERLEIQSFAKINAANFAKFSEINDMYGNAFIIATDSGTYDMSKKQGTGVSVFYGSSGNDTLIGNSSSQTLYGNDGNDTLNGMDGDDILDGGEGADFMVGGAGNDTFIVGNEDAGTFIYGNEGINTIATGYYFAEGDISKAAIANIQRLVGSFKLNAAQLAEITTLEAPNYYGTLTAYTAGTYDLTGKNITGIYNLAGSTGDDTLIGDGTSQELSGNDGNDTLKGMNGDDRLTGGMGADLMYGGNGSDTFLLNSWQGNEVGVGEIIDGGDGTDTLQVSSGYYGDPVNLANATITGVEQLELSGFAILTQQQLNAFTTIKGFGTLIAANAGTYDLSSKTMDISINQQGIINLTGSSGNDTLIGDREAQTLSGGEGDDILKGMNGDDQLDGGTNNDMLYGGNGNDTLYGGSGNDTLYGGDGNDTLQDGDGIDRLYGENGDDVFTYSYNTATAGTIIDGGAGTDTIQAVNADLSEATIINIERLEVYYGVTLKEEQLPFIGQIIDMTGGSNIKIIKKELRGTEGNDTLNGDDRGIPMYGLGGNDVINGFGGDDMLDGGAGNDTLTGGAGADKQYGGAGDDLFIFGSQNDIAAGELVDGGADTDTIRASNIDLSSISITGIEKLEISGNTTLTAAQLSGVTQIVSQSGTITLTAAGAGTYDLTGKTTATVNLQGSSGNDVLTGDGTSQEISGNDGNDTLNGMAGNDTLNGGAGNDTLNGGLGNDTLTGGTGADRLYGNDGNDIFILNGTDVASGEIIDGGTGTDILKSYDGVNLSSATLTGIEQLDVYGATTLTAAQFAGMATINGMTANNTLVAASAGTYDLSKKKGTGALNFVGSSGNDIVTGNAASQTLYGMDGNDTLKGNTGNDTLIGGSGADKLYGDAGNDNFVYNNANEIAAGEIIDGGAGADVIQAKTAINLSGATIKAVEKLELSGDVTLTLAQFNGFDAFAAMTGTATLIAANAGTYDLSKKTLTGIVNLTGSSGNDKLTGTTGTNTLNGAAGNDTLEGLAGNDNLYGGTGNDTYLFGRGSGADTIYENDNTAGNSDVVKFDKGIKQNQLWMGRQGNDLVVQIIGTQDKVVVNNWYSGTAFKVEKFQTSDGKTLDTTQVQNLVNAMARFSVPSTEILPQSYQSQLDPIIAASWR